MNKPVSRHDLRTRQILRLNAIVLVFFIAVLSVLNIFLFKENNSLLSDIDAKHFKKLDIITQMSHIARERSLAMLAMYLTRDPWNKDEQFMHFHSLAPKFIKLRDRLQATGLSHSEELQLGKALSLIRRTEPLQKSIVERIQSGSLDQVTIELIEKDLPMEDQLNDLLQTFIHNVRNETNLNRQLAREKYIRSMYVAISATLFVTLVILFLIRRSAREVQQIESSLISDKRNLGWYATHDQLTGIYNRRWLEIRLQEMGNSSSSEATHSIIFVDLDNFKPINDQYGHDVGDKLLKGVAREMKHCIRKEDALIRMGGDEFVVLLENCAVEVATKIANCLLKSVSEHEVTENLKHVSGVTCSIGVSVFREGQLDMASLIRQADEACLDAKKNGKNQVNVFNTVT